MVRLLGIGDNTVDIYLTEEMQYPGGNALNVAVYARRAGAEASYLGCIGRDPRSALIERSLLAEGVDISHLRRIEGTTSFSRVSHHGADRVFVGGNPGVRAQYDLTTEDETFIARHDIVHTSIYSDLDAALPRLRRAAKRLSYDYSEQWRRPGAAATLKDVDIAFLSNPDRSVSDCKALARGCASEGAATVVVTRGAEGALALANGQLFVEAAQPATVLDTLGAGDAFIAGFLVSHMRGDHLAKSLRCGAALAALACGVRGAFGHGIPVPILPGSPEPEPRPAHRPEPRRALEDSSSTSQSNRSHRRNHP